MTSLCKCGGNELLYNFCQNVIGKQQYHDGCYRATSYLQNSCRINRATYLEASQTPCTQKRDYCMSEENGTHKEIRNGCCLNYTYRMKHLVCNHIRLSMHKILDRLTFSSYRCRKREALNRKVIWTIIQSVELWPQTVVIRYHNLLEILAYKLQTSHKLLDNRYVAFASHGTCCRKDPERVRPSNTWTHNCACLINGVVHNPLRTGSGGRMWNLSICCNTAGWVSFGPAKYDMHVHTNTVWNIMPVSVMSGYCA